MDPKDAAFTTTPSFCPDCGSILPFLGETGGVTCYACLKYWGPTVFGDLSMSHTIHFNDIQSLVSNVKTEKNKGEADGPVVERQCPQCKNDKMSYSTLQLRSADEGQTVFYTCTKCKYKETENS